MNDVKPGLERAKMEARWKEQVELQELEKPLCESSSVTGQILPVRIM